MSVDPLARRRSLPPEARRAELRIAGWPIRTMHWSPAPNAMGSLLFIGGRADFIEKYAEAYWTWNVDWGLGLAAFDWRGQGLSGRLGDDPHKGHCDSFDRWVDDLGAVVDWFTATLPGPHYIVAHSMGGHLTLRHLAHGDGRIARAVLLAPMLGIHTSPLRPNAARRLSEMAVRLGLAKRYGLLQRGYGAWQQRPERQALLTDCAERFADEHWWLAQQPELALGGVTYGWLASAYRSIDALLADGTLESIATPLLILSGEHERLIDATAIRSAADRLPHAACETIAGGRHELLRDTNSVRGVVQARIRRFLLDGE